MTRAMALGLAAGALALSGCQTTGKDYVKLRPGPTLEVATAGCKAYAQKASHVVIGVGSIEAAAIGLVATIAATAARRAMVFEHCMAAQGYWKAGKKPPAPAQAAGPATPAAAKAAPGKTASAKKPPAR